MPNASPISEYLAELPPAQRAALQKLRKAILAAAPGAEECISYKLPAFRLNGKALVAFGAATNHCAFYPMSARTVGQHKAELSRFETSKAAILFTPETPLSATLVRKLVKARIAENAVGRSGVPNAGKKVRTGVGPKARDSSKKKTVRNASRRR